MVRTGARFVTPACFRWALTFVLAAFLIGGPAGLSVARPDKPEAKPAATAAKPTAKPKTSTTTPAAAPKADPRPVKAGKPGGEVGLLTSTLRMVGALGLVLGLMILILWLARRYLFDRFKVTGGPLVTVLASRHIAPRRQVVVVRVADQVLVLGVTGDSINLLSRLDDTEAVHDALASQIHSTFRWRPPKASGTDSSSGGAG